METSNSGDGNMEHWRQFQGTELGGLLSSIYGNHNKPKINYPKPKTKPMNPDALKGFQYCGSKPGATDPRKTTRRDVKVNVPKLNGGREGRTYSQIDFCPKRKSADMIKEEMKDTEMRISAYRPAHTHSISSEAEKDRFSQICAYKGGKGLPTEMTGPIQVAPFELEQQRLEKQRMYDVKNKRLGLPKGTKPEVKENLTEGGNTKMSEKEQFAELIVEEIEDRRKYLEEMKSMGGLSKQQENFVKAEISQRLEELKKYEDF